MQRNVRENGVLVTSLYAIFVKRRQKFQYYTAISGFGNLPILAPKIQNFQFIKNSYDIQNIR